MRHSLLDDGDLQGKFKLVSVKRSEFTQCYYVALTCHVQLFNENCLMILNCILFDLLFYLRTRHPMEE